jgi:transposase, IS5 family
LPVRLVAGFLILKHMHSLSDEAVCARWVENPYFEYLCGERVFRHALAFDRSSLTRWRQRLGEERLSALLQESLRVARETEALATKDLERVAVDTTVQPKAIAHPADAKLTHKAIEKLAGFAKRRGVALRQSYLRVAKRAAIMVSRYTHAHQFKRANRELKFLRTREGKAHPRHQPQDLRRPGARRTLRAPARIGGQGPLPESAPARAEGLFAARPEVECIGKGKARAPYEFGCKVSIAVPVTHPKGGQFVLHAKALHGNPFDGHTLKGALADVESNTGVEIRRIHVDKGYRGHDYPNRFRVFISGQVWRTTAAIKREMKRRAAVEPVIGHLKADHRMDRNYLVVREEPQEALIAGVCGDFEVFDFAGVGSREGRKLAN